MKVCVKSYGCAANIAEGEMMAGLLGPSHEIAPERDADTVVLNICTVKGDAPALREIRHARESGKRLVIAGCITPALAGRLQRELPGAALISTHQLGRVPEAVASAGTGQALVALERSTDSKLGHPRGRKNPVIGIIPVSSGCLDACAFCSTRLVKGRLVSFPPEHILEEAKDAISEGCKELWLTGQDASCYGFDIGTDLPCLIGRLCNIPGDFRIRIGMGNPRHVPRYLDRLVAAMQHPKVFKFIHLPVQSGSSAVLKAMRRGHTAETFRELARRFREAFPDITLSTDIIVGYPGETREQFLETVALVRELQPDVLNLARFAPREGTFAATMPGQVDPVEKKARSTELAEAFAWVALDRNRRWLGRTCEVIIDEPGTLAGTMIGRNDSYKPVIVRGTYPLGARLTVRITDFTSHDLRGTPL
jgi:MiaB-like tRNA modifying enzyme